jgi:exodeoxyribonuclease VIII
LGSAFHSILLEPDVFCNEFAILPEIDRRSNAGKADYAAFVAENQGKTLISVETYEIIHSMREAVVDHGGARTLLSSDGEAENSVYWNDPETKLTCRCRPDLWRSDNIIVDVKTTEDASPEGFARSVAKYRYHVQAAFYTWGIEQVIGTRPEGFVFLAVEKKPPYAVGLYMLDPVSLEVGAREFREDINLLAKCNTTGDFPSYGGSTIQSLSLPLWYLKSSMEAGAE